MSGKVGVSARVRNFLPWEEEKPCLEYQKNSIGIPVRERHVGVFGQNETVNFFEFNRKVFKETDNTENVFENLCKPLCDNLLDGNGYNSMLIAYGQTGSGKTFTLLGTQNLNKQPTIGVLPMMINYLNSSQKCVKCTLSAVEIYGIKETKLDYFDLFNDNCHPKGSDKNWAEKKSSTLQKSSEESVWDIKSRELPKSDKDIGYQLVLEAQSNAHYAPTAKNPRSSRGHTVFIVNVHFGDNQYNHLIVMDLAGSEGISALPLHFRRKIGDALYSMRKLEAGIINYGLGQLRDIIKEISSPKGISKVEGNGLRKFLHPFVGQNSKPMINIMFTFSPSITNIESTRSTLRVSHFVSGVKIVPSKITRKKPMKQVVRELRQELQNKDLYIEKLESQIASFERESVLHKSTENEVLGINELDDEYAIESEIKAEHCLDLSDLLNKRKKLNEREAALEMELEDTLDNEELQDLEAELADIRKQKQRVETNIAEMKMIEADVKAAVVRDSANTAVLYQAVNAFKSNLDQKKPFTIAEDGITNPLINRVHELEEQQHSLIRRQRVSREERNQEMMRLCQKMIDMYENLT